MDIERLSLGTIRCIGEVLTAKSVTVAAERLGISQSAVSQQIARFEKLTGIPVVARNGARLAIRSNEAARAISAMMEPIDAMRCIALGKDIGKLRLGISEYVAARYCSNIELFIELEKEFDVLIGRTLNLSEMYNNGELDAVLRPLFHHESEMDLMTDVPLVWVASEALAEEIADKIHLNPIPVILEAAPSPYSYYAERSLREAQIRYKVASRVDDSLVRIHLVSAGVGCIAIPKFALSTLPSAEKIRIVPKIPDTSHIRFGLFFNKKLMPYKKASQIFEAISGEIA